MIGFFANTLVLRADLSGDPTFLDLLAQVREETVGAYAHQDLPFDLLVEELQPQRHLGRTPLFQVMFILQTAPVDALELPGLALTLMETDTRTSKFDLTLELLETEQGMSGSIEYNTDLLDSATVISLIGHFENLLEDIVENPEKPLSRLRITAAEEEFLMCIDSVRDLEMELEF